MEGIWTSLIDDVWNIHLAFMGFLVSVITLLYASLSSKVEELNSIKKSKDYSLMNRVTAINNSIKQFRYLNKQVMKGLLISFCIFVLTTILKYLPEGCIIKCIVILIAITTIVLIVFGFKLAYGIYSLYQKETF